MSEPSCEFRFPQYDFTFLRHLKAHQRESITPSAFRPISEACITALRPLQADDFGFVFIDGKLYTGLVITLHSKTAGKYGKHAAVTDSSSIAVISYLGVQVFENTTANHFSATLQATVPLDTRYYQHIFSIQFLLVLPSSVITIQRNGGLVMENGYHMNIFRDLISKANKLKAALKVFNPRGG
ncbi:hypothetical protein BDQ17DRAFT_1426796 [Cyathus striatus]|nr:hypothetical protein BDQ17DRAFT_1426796 [Cyathus striatus]